MMNMDVEQLQAIMKEYIKPEYQESAHNMMVELDTKRKAGTLSKMDVLKMLPQAQHMIKPEYRDKAMNLISQFNRLE